MNHQIEIATGEGADFKVTKFDFDVCFAIVVPVIGLERNNF